MRNFKFYHEEPLFVEPTFLEQLEHLASLKHDRPEKYTPADIWPNMFRGGLTQTQKERAIAKYTPKSIEYSADHTTVVVIWSDGDKTIVRRSANDPDDIYMAFTAALAKKIFGSNSAVKRIIRNKTNEHQPKKKKNAATFDDVCNYFQTLAKIANKSPMPGEIVKSGIVDTVEDLGIVVPDALEVDGRIKRLDADIKRKINGEVVPLGPLTDHINDWLAERGGATREEINNEIVRRWKEDE